MHLAFLISVLLRLFVLNPLFVFCKFLSFNSLAKGKQNHHDEYEPEYEYQPEYEYDDDDDDDDGTENWVIVTISILGVVAFVGIICTIVFSYLYCKTKKKLHEARVPVTVESTKLPTPPVAPPVDVNIYAGDFTVVNPNREDHVNDCAHPNNIDLFVNSETGGVSLMSSDFIHKPYNLQDSV